jgi:hypothetical protein
MLAFNFETRFHFSHRRKQTMNLIRIACETSDALPYLDLEPFQGDAKILHKTEFEQLRQTIIDDGFSFAIHYWVSPDDGKCYIIDGHQRRATVKQMVEIEGYECPDLPVVRVLAETYEEAKRKVLSGISQYGRINEKGIYQLMIETGESAAELLARVRIPEINVGKFVEQYFGQQQSENDADKAPPSNGTSNMGTHSENVRMIQLFFNAVDHENFMQMIEILGKHFETDNVTDTVLKAINEAYRSLPNQ